MTYATKRQIAYAFSFLFGTLLSVGYILWASDILQKGFTVESVRTSVAFAIGFLVFKVIKDFRRQTLKNKNAHPAMQAFSMALFKMLPWVLGILIAIAIRAGIYNLFFHLVVFSSLQITSIVFFGFEEYYSIKEEGANP